MTLMQANKEIYTTCGGMSYKKCGCDYSIYNFKNLQIYHLQKILEKAYLEAYAKTINRVNKLQQVMKIRNANIGL